ncbi:hypothetical protein Tco_0756333 [Tanacetum coccineum]
MVVQEQAKIGEGSANPTDLHHTPTIIQPSPQPQKKQKPIKPKRKDTQIPQSSGLTKHVADRAIYKELDDSLVRAATTASSLEAEQDSGNIDKTQSKAIPNEAGSQGTTLCARVESSGDVESLEPEVAVKDVNLTVDEVTLAQVLAALKSVKPKEKANVVEEPSVPVSAASTKAKVQDKGKGIMVEKPMKSMIKKDLVRLDEEITSKLQAKFDEEERLAREKDEANVALTEEWDDIQAKVNVDYQLAQRMQAQEQEGLIDEEKARLFVQFLEQRRKHFAAKRAEEKWNKPPTQAQQRKIICTYLKNMEGKKPKDLKNKSFDSIQKMFDKACKRVNTFVDFRTDLVEAEVYDDQEAAKIKELMDIVPDKEEVAIDAITLVVKPPSIVDWKIHK